MSTAQNIENIPNKDLSKIAAKGSAKIKYSIHSIAEEDSKSSSSRSSVKSSDDLTYVFSKKDRPSKKRSSYLKKSKLNSNPTSSGSIPSDSSRIMTSFRKPKKYTEGAISVFSEIKEKMKKEKKRRRINSMTISLTKLSD